MISGNPYGFCLLLLMLGQPWSEILVSFGGVVRGVAMAGQGSFVFLPEEEDEQRREAFAYWLRHCEGFRVESVNGRLGIVQDVRRTLDEGIANALVVRGGLLGRTVMIVPTDQVECLVPREERVILHPNPQVVHPPTQPKRAIKLTPLLPHG